MAESTRRSRLDLDGEYVVTDAIRERFDRDGHVLVPGVASDEEIAFYRRAITATADRFNTETRPLDERSTYGKAFLQIMNLWTRDEVVRRFVFSRRFAKLAADLMGVQGVRLYHDQALYKEPGGGPTPFHQDMYYWPLDTDRTVTMWIPLVPITSEMGSMTFVDGSHRMGYLGEVPISDASEGLFREFIESRHLATTTYGAMRAGDATFHAGWTLHGAPGNPTSTMREVMTVIYMADETRVSEPDNENRKLDLETWLPGLAPGDLAASPLNPVLWSR